MGRYDDVDVMRTPTALWALLEAAEQRGLSASRCLAGSGLSSEELFESDMEIAWAQELAVIRNIVRLTGNESGLGWQVGQSVTIAKLGVLGLAMLSSPTLRALMEVASDYGFGKLSWIFVRPRIEVDARGLEVTLDASALPEDVQSFVIERDLAYVISLLRLLLRPGFPVSLDTGLDARRAAPCAVTQEAGARSDSLRNVFFMPASAFDLPLPNGDPHGLRVCRQQCDALMSHRPQAPSSMTARTRRALLCQPARLQTLADVAGRLHIHPRSLSRRLQDEGTSFSALVDDVRLNLAIELLTSEETVETVAGRLGYADAASFTRAFKRWTGSTPGQAARRSRLDELASGAQVAAGSSPNLSM